MIAVIVEVFSLLFFSTFEDSVYLDQCHSTSPEEKVSPTLSIDRRIGKLIIRLIPISLSMEKDQPCLF